MLTAAFIITVAFKGCLKILLDVLGRFPGL